MADSQRIAPVMATVVVPPPSPFHRLMHPMSAPAPPPLPPPPPPPSPSYRPIRKNTKCGAESCRLDTGAGATFCPWHICASPGCKFQAVSPFIFCVMHTRRAKAAATDSDSHSNEYDVRGMYLLEVKVKDISYYYCFSRGDFGDAVIDAIQKKTGDYRSALKMIAHKKYEVPRDMVKNNIGKLIVCSFE